MCCRPLRRRGHPTSDSAPVKATALSRMRGVESMRVVWKVLLRVWDWCARRQEYSQLEPEQSQVVNTAWAVLALIAAGYHVRDAAPVQAGVTCLLAAQLPSGDWPQQHISGVFNRNCMITYANYRRAPALWLLCCTPGACTAAWYGPLPACPAHH